MRKHMAVGSWVLVGAACIGLAMPAHDATPAQVSVVEFHHSDFGHYFLTTLPAEMALLDAGAIPGWQRTWTEFKVDDAPGPNLVPVCRFFSSAFAPLSSHFYSAFDDECNTVAANPQWTYEGTAFYAGLPDAIGRCPDGTTPIYRGYNMGQGGAPAHRLSPWPQAACDHFAPQCTLEGRGWNGVAFCAPVSTDLALDRVRQLAGSSWVVTEVANGETRTRRVAFEAYIVRLDWEFSPYVVRVSDPDWGGARWNGLAGKMEVMLWWDGPWDMNHTVYQFDYDGGDAVTGCAYRFWDDQAELRGRCHPMTGRKF